MIRGSVARSLAKSFRPHARWMGSNKGSSRDQSAEAATPTIPLMEQDDQPAIRKTDEQVIKEVIDGELSSTSLERELKDFTRAVRRFSSCFSFCCLRLLTGPSCRCQSVGA